MKVLLLEPFCKPYVPELNNLFQDIEFIEAYTEKIIANQIGDSDAVFGYINSDQLSAGKKLKWIQTPDAGMEGLFENIPELAESEVIITNSRGAGAPIIGEHALALMLALSRKLPIFFKDKSNKKWDQEGGLDKVQYLGDKTVGIIGYGRSGKEIAWRCKLLGMNVVGLDINPVDPDKAVQSVMGYDHLPDLLELSDYVVVTAPYSPKNSEMIGSKEFELMKPTSYLIVTSRGRLFNENALVKALKEKQISGAALDTVWPEPLPANSPLWDIPNLIITPHIAGNAEKKMLDGRTIDILKENLSRFASKRKLTNIVDKNLWY